VEKRLKRLHACVGKLEIQGYQDEGWIVLGRQFEAGNLGLFVWVARKNRAIGRGDSSGEASQGSKQAMTMRQTSVGDCVSVHAAAHGTWKVVRCPAIAGPMSEEADAACCTSPGLRRLRKVCGILSTTFPKSLGQTPVTPRRSITLTHTGADLRSDRPTR
jgi:hypothetical protein